MPSSGKITTPRTYFGDDDAKRTMGDGAHGFCGPLPTGEYLLVAIDRYSRYPEVEMARSTKASTVIPKLDQMFARHGIPTIVKSDNGPPFNGTQYKHYLEVLGIKAKYATPKWPQVMRRKRDSCSLSAKP